MVFPAATAAKTVDEVSRERVIDFAQQLGVMLQHVNKARENINQGRASKDILASQGAANEAMRVGSQLVESQKSFDKLVSTITTKTKRMSVESAEELLTDIGERLKLSDAFYAEWRRLLAQHDVEARTGVYESEDGATSRGITEERIAEAKKAFDAAIQAAWDLVPSPGVIQLS